MNYFETITKFLPSAVDKYFVRDSQSVILEHGSKYIDVSFDEAGYVKIATRLMDGLSDYYRTQENPSNNPLPGYTPDAANLGNGYAAYAGNTPAGRDGLDIGGASVQWEIHQLQWLRGRQIRIDHISNEETAKVLTGGMIEDFHKYKVIPEVDACRFGTIADSASVSMGNLVTETVGTDITESNILTKFFTMRQWLVEHEADEADIVWFVSPSVYTILMNSEKLVKFITQDDYRSDKGLTFKIQKFLDIPIVEVVPSRFFTKVQTTRNGFQASQASKAINYMMVDKKSIIPIRKIEWQKLYDEEQAGLLGFYGVVFNYLLYHGLVIPRNKLIGTYVSVAESGTALAKVNTLVVDIREGSAQYSWRLKAYFTAPSGLRGTVVYAAGTGDNNATNPFVVGQSVTIDGSTVKAVQLDEEVSEAAGSKKYFFALVDYRGICIATTVNEVTMVQHA